MGAGGVKNFSVGICDGAPSTARSSLKLALSKPRRQVFSQQGPAHMILTSPRDNSITVNVLKF